MQSMTNIQTATDALKPGETALCIYTEGHNLSINADGSGSSGWWVLDPDREVDRVVIYLKASEDRITNDIYVGDPDDIDGPRQEDGRYRVLLANLQLVGHTDANWYSFAAAGQNPIRYVSKPATK